MKTSILLSLLVLVSLSACSRASESSSGPGSTLRIDRLLRGEQAIEGLGEHLDDVAGNYRMSGRQLRQLFRQDGTLAVDPRGRLLYAEEAATDTSQVPELPFNPTADAIPADRTFALHSRPQSSQKIYLNFVGGPITNTAWNAGAAPIEAAPYSRDADPAFSDTELRDIRAIWLHVTEDFAPFDVDVTTEPTGPLTQAKSIEIVFTPTSEWFGRAGGVCYTGNWDWSGERKVCWVFSTLLNNNTKQVAEAASHETGHSLGLSHWAKYNADGSLAAAYYAGHGNWAPIMGVGYYRGVTTWSKGEYEGAGIWSLGNVIDDVAILSRAAGFVPDDAGDSEATASRLTRAGGIGTSPIQHEGILHSAADRDVYRLDLGADGLALQVAPAGYAPDAHLRVRLLREDGSVYVELWPDSIVPLQVGNAGVPKGIYYLEISPAGYGNPATTGYSAYGSTGRYFVTGDYLRGPSEGGISTPTPTPIPSPSATPWPSATPAASATPVSTPTPSFTPTPTPEVFNYRQVVARYDQTCVIQQDRSLHCFGRNDVRQIAPDAPNEIFAPVRIDAGTGYQQVAIGVRHACGLTLDGTVKCWGENAYGNLGDGTFVRRDTPVVADNGVRYRQIAVGYRHTCGITTGNVLRCWGRNASGQLGIGPSVDLATATTVDAGETYYQVDTGYQQTCAVTLQGRLKCWGLNTRGEVGDGTKTARSFPVAIDPTSLYSSVSTGIYHTCAVALTGELRCWGDNAQAQLGTGDFVEHLTPTKTVFDPPITVPVHGVSAGYTDTCAVIDGGQVRCTGQNNDYLFGNGASEYWQGRFVPAMTGVTARTVSTGFGHSCALSVTAPEAWCAGDGHFGQLGAGPSATWVTRPVRALLDL